MLERIPLDLDSKTRESGMNIDMGPYEFQQSYFVGGEVTGLLSSNAMTLQNNLNDDLVVEQNGAFAFSLPVAVNDDYDVSILAHPNDPIQPCTVVNQAGSITDQDITDVVVTCEAGDDLIFRDGF